MRYGGHQTFVIRDGWLHKGLSLLVDESNRSKLVDEYAADYLGVGRNMAKAINHWLVASGLAQKKRVMGNNQIEIETKDLVPTELAHLIQQYDPYFLDLGTWWLIHINLVNNKNHAATWYWFFNYFNLDRFQKNVCVQTLLRKEALFNAGKIPSETTIDRDVSCFFSSYAKDIPTRNKDPEDEIECPLVELGLMNYYRSSGYYHVVKSKKDIPIDIFLYSISMVYQDESNLSKEIQIPYYDLIKKECSPGRVFALTNEGLFDLILGYEQKQNSHINIVGLAGERMIQFQLLSPLECVKQYYQGVN